MQRVCVGYMELDKRRAEMLSGPHRAGGAQLHRHRQQRAIQRVDEDLNGSSTVRGHR